MKKSAAAAVGAQLSHYHLMMCETFHQEPLICADRAKQPRVDVLPSEGVHCICVVSVMCSRNAVNVGRPTTPEMFCAYENKVGGGWERDSLTATF